MFPQGGLLTNEIKLSSSLPTRPTGQTPTSKTTQSTATTGSPHTARCQRRAHVAHRRQYPGTTRHPWLQPTIHLPLLLLRHRRRFWTHQTREHPPLAAERIERTTTKKTAFFALSWWQPCTKGSDFLTRPSLPAATTCPRISLSRLWLASPPLDLRRSATTRCTICRLVVKARVLYDVVWHCLFRVWLSTFKVKTEVSSKRSSRDTHTQIHTHTYEHNPTYCQRRRHYGM